MVGAAMCLGLPRGPASIRWESERVGHEGTEGKGRGGGLARHSAPAGLVLWGPAVHLYLSLFDALTSSVCEMFKVGRQIDFFADIYNSRLCSRSQKQKLEIKLPELVSLSSSSCSVASTVYIIYKRVVSTL